MQGSSTIDNGTTSSKRRISRFAGNPFTFIQLLNYWIPKKFGDSDDGSSLLRARVFTSIMLFGAALTSLIVFVLVIFSLLIEKNFWVTAATMAAACGFFMTFLYGFKKTTNLTLFANLFVLFLMIGLVRVLLGVGGWNELGTFLLLLLPIAAFPIMERKYSLGWSFISLFIYILFFYYADIDTSHFLIIEIENLDYLILGLWNLCLLIIIISLSFYDGIAENLTAVLQVEKDRFLHEAQYDPLTGAYNRETFEEHLQTSLESLTENQTRLCLIGLQIKNLEALCSQIGYALGDRLLQTITERCHVNNGVDSTLCRYAPDTFLILIEDSTEFGAVLSLFYKVKNRLAQPVSFEQGINLSIDSGFCAAFTSDPALPGNEFIDTVLNAVSDETDSENPFIYC